MKAQKVFMIGGGAVNLITAYYLVRRGYELEIIDKGAPPHRGKSHPGASWSGKDARMFTYTEADNYNNPSPIPSAENTLFARSLDELGWDARISRGEEAEWIKAHAQLPFQTAHQCKEDVVRFNLESAPLWEEMMQESPFLFQDAVLRDGIVRMYTDRDHFQRQVVRHQALKSLVRTYEPVAELLDEMPGLEAAVYRNEIASAMRTHGFTLNAHKFFRNLVKYLKEKGTVFSWREEALEVEKNQSGKVIAVHTNRRSIVGGHLVLSPGAYGHRLLNNTASRRLICGVLGAWATIPNPGRRFAHSMKIARKGHVTEDANVTLATENGADVLHVGSGYGFSGFDPDNISPEQLELMYKGIEDTVRRFFPEIYALPGVRERLSGTFSYCVRPWTSNGRGIFEQSPTAAGGTLVVTGGHNTGGFAQSPAVGQAVLAALAGENHAMHSCYHPQNHARKKVFLLPQDQVRLVK